jgi:hypothetical protein
LPGADWKAGERLTWSFGAGLGLPEARPAVVLKSRVEYEFGRKTPLIEPVQNQRPTR